MGLLDELKNQADSIRDGQEKAAAIKAQQEAYYESHLLPALKQALGYLDELVKQINFINPECLVEYPLAPDRRQTITLKQQPCRLAIDSSERPRQVDIRAKAEFLQQPVFELETPKAVLAYAEYLDKFGLPYHRQDGIDSRHELERATFILEGPLQLAVRLTADPVQERIHVFLKNFTKPGIQQYSFRAEQVNEDLLDRIGRVVLRQSETLTKPSQLSDEELNRIRQQLAAEKQRQAEEEQRQLEAQNQREQALAEQSSLKHRLRRVLTSPIKNSSAKKGANEEANSK